MYASRLTWRCILSLSQRFLFFWIKKTIESSEGVLWYLAPRHYQQILSVCKLRGEASMGRTSMDSAHPTDALLDWGEFWGQVSTLNCFSCSSNMFLNNFCQCGRAYYPAWKRPLLLGYTVSMKGSPGLQQCLGSWDSSDQATFFLYSMVQFWW